MNVDYSDLNKIQLPPQEAQLKLVNVALKVQQETTIELLNRTRQLLDVLA